MSLDGYIAGPDAELDWLQEARFRRVASPTPKLNGSWLSYDDFIADIGALLMGRGTFDVVSGFDSWPYGDLAVVVASHRPLPDSTPSSVTSASSDPAGLLAAAQERAGGGDVYVDGGQLVSAFVDEGLLDELITTVLPTARGEGIGLFDALRSPHNLDLVGVATSDGGAVQLSWVPHR